MSFQLVHLYTDIRGGDDPVPQTSAFSDAAGTPRGGGRACAQGADYFLIHRAPALTPEDTLTGTGCVFCNACLPLSGIPSCLSACPPLRSESYSDSHAVAGSLL